MATIYYEKDADPGALQGQRIAVLGYGSQGHAYALNLRDSGHDVRVGLRQGSKSWAKAEEHGLPVRTTAEAAAEADVVMMLQPDTAQADVYAHEVEPGLQPGNLLLFAHGFNIHFNQIRPAESLDVAMVAPKGPGHLVRRTYADGIGGARAGVIETTFAEETETDLFGEQAVLCGGVTALVTSGFQTLVEAGYQPEIAYFECLHELKLIVDLMYEGGLGGMRYSVSDTAEYGDYTRGPRVVDDRTREEMRRILGEVRSGEFAKEWVLEARAGYPKFEALRAAGRDELIEEVGTGLRSMMPWLKRD